MDTPTYGSEPPAKLADLSFRAWCTVTESLDRLDDSSKDLSGCRAKLVREKGGGRILSGQGFGEKSKQREDLFYLVIASGKLVGPVDCASAEVNR